MIVLITEITTLDSDTGTVTCFHGTDYTATEDGAAEF